MRRSLKWFVLAAVLGVTVFVVRLGIDTRLIALETLIPDGSAQEDTMTYDARWQAVDQLIEEHKYQAALDQVEKLLIEARQMGDEEYQGRALIRRTQLRIGLHGFETAVRDLRAEPWPVEPKLGLPVQLYYAHALTSYIQAYSWEIRQRERVESTSDELDLKAWTLDQLLDEAHRAYQDVWAQREAWGATPIGELDEYIDPNQFPPHIRGTLRDTASYLWAELLANSSYWPADSSSLTWRLDVSELLAGASISALDAPLDGLDGHPLRRLSAVLADLEAWHRQHKRPEAAFEAHRARAEQLWYHFDKDGDRALLREDLAARLDQLGQEHAWWSYGQWQLATFVQQLDTPGALIQARELARQGREAHPQSPGGIRCKELIARIEVPEYNLTTMKSDAPGRRSIQVNYKNLEALYFRAYPVNLFAQVDGATGRSLLPDSSEIPNILENHDYIDAWDVELPPTRDYRNHLAYVTLPETLEPGLYVIAASTNRGFLEFSSSKHGSRRTAVNVIVGDLVLLMRQLDEDGARRFEVTARSGATGDLLEGAGVSFYKLNWNRGGHQLAATRRTGEDGRALFPASALGDGPFALLGRHGQDVAIGAEHMWVRPIYDSNEVVTRALLYTDRSIYRPGQQVHWKAVVYRGHAENGEFKTLPDHHLTVRLEDANGQEAAEVTVRTNAFGSAAGTFNIPAGRLLGSWSLSAAGQGWTSIQVEEYKRPTFEVTVQDAAEPLRLNRPAELTAEARYYFGLPVNAGEVSWRVTRVPRFPPWWFWWGGAPGGEEQVIADGSGTLADDGTFDVNFTPEADERDAEDGVTYRYRLDVDVTDEGGETRSGSRTFHLGFSAVDARIDLAAGFYVEGDPVRVTVRRTDLDGIARAGSGTWTLAPLQAPDEVVLPADMPINRPTQRPRPNEEHKEENGEENPYATPGDRLRPRWSTEIHTQAILRGWPAGPERSRGELQHHVEPASLDLGLLPPGAWRLCYHTEDPFGRLFETCNDLIVAATQAGASAPRLPLLLQAEKTSVRAGETLRLLAASGLEGQPLVLEVFRGLRRLNRQVLTAGRDPQLIEIPVTLADRGGFSVTLTSLRDHQQLRLQEHIQVPWHDRRLQVEFSTFRDRLRPGQSETWKVTVRSDDEQALSAGAAEVLAYMYDRSLDIFAGHNPVDVQALYPTHAQWQTLESGLGQAWMAWQHNQGFGELPSSSPLRTDRLKYFDNFGIGGIGPRSRAMKMRVPSAPSPPMFEADAIAVADAPMVAESLAVGAAMEVGTEEELRALSSVDDAPPPPPPPPGAEQEPVRKDFAETAFWVPQLLTGDDGSVSFEFTVPDSVTEWNVWAHAVTQDLRGGAVHKTTRSVKELLVRPYLPRFLREGDAARIKVVVQNAGDEAFEGQLDFGLFAPLTAPADGSDTSPDTSELGPSRLADFGLTTADTRGLDFQLDPGGSTTFTFPLVNPRGVGEVVVRAVARAGSFQDGEQRPLPLLPGRIHLIQSRFATLHSGAGESARRELHFADLAAQASSASTDPTMLQEQLVVTLDAQLFYGVLQALPYLVDYPYECTEQTLNRFVSTGILSTLYGDYPAVARMAEQLSSRDTVFEAWDGPDPNRALALEETPWVQMAQGGGEVPYDLLNVLDPRRTGQLRQAALAKLREAQTAQGGFPWWPGGPPSTYITLYLLDGFSRALEFGVEVPKDMVVRAWGYMKRYWDRELVEQLKQGKASPHILTYMSYVLSSYPDASWTGNNFTDGDRATMLAAAFESWKNNSPRLKAYLSLALHRADRTEDARLVFDSILDSARTTEDEGTFWAPEDRAWLWYNDTVESHAFVLRALLELQPDNELRHGLVQWLFLNKKLNHWKSTRATAEAIYGLVHYLQAEDLLAVREAVQVRIGDRQRDFEFDPDTFTGKGVQWQLEGDEIDPATDSTIVVEKDTPGFLFASATWHFSTETPPKEARGNFFHVERAYFKRERSGSGGGSDWVLRPLADGTRVEIGDQVEVQVSLRSKHAAEYVHLRDPRPAGFEPETLSSGVQWDLGIWWYEEVRDSGTNFFFERLPVGEYTFKYRLRATTAGSFQAAPAQVQSMYAPEFVAYSAGGRVEIEGGE